MKALKFLIADDFPINLKLLRAGLEAEGHQVVEAADGIEALAILSRGGVDRGGACDTREPLPSTQARYGER